MINNQKIKPIHVGVYIIHTYVPFSPTVIDELASQMIAYTDALHNNNSRKNRPFRVHTRSTRVLEYSIGKRSNDNVRIPEKISRPD